MGRRVSRRFYDLGALQLARALLGKTLVHDSGGVRRAARIVETEAYVGEHDLACHSSKGRTKRTRVMFGPPGRSYVYLIYGMYHCFNVVSGPGAAGAAVLVRGVQPLIGISEGARTDGPGRLCRALGITLAHNDLDLSGEELFLEHGRAPARIARGPRIGVDYAREWAAKPYRFWERDNPFVSRPR